MFNRVVAAVCVLCLVACAAPHPRRTKPPVTVPASTSLQALPPAGEYKIDSGNSEIRLLVYRAGPLARLGHNHVMVNRAVTGRAQIGDSISTSAFFLQLPASAFSVDETQSRTEEGDDFPGEIPEDAKSGTRRNMLSAAVLNAAEFPDITVKSVSLSGGLDAVTAQVEISAAGRSSTLSTPLSLQGDAQHFVVAGSMELRQTSLGLTPYSLMGGALQVQDAMQLKFKVMLLTN